LDLDVIGGNFNKKTNNYHDLTPFDPGNLGHVFWGSNFTKMAISFVLFVIEQKF